MPEVEYDDRSDEPEWRLPSRTDPGIVGRAIDENQHATHPSRPSHSVDDSEYQLEVGDWIPRMPPDLPLFQLLGVGLGWLTAGLAIVILSGDIGWGWIALVGIGMLSLSAALISYRSRR